MYSSYLKVMIRNFQRQPLFSFINIFGLAIGMTSAILIFLWVQDEISYDSFNKNAKDIYRVVENQYYAGGKLFPVAVTPALLAKSLKDNYPEIINSARLRFGGDLLRYEDKNFIESTVFVDPEFLKMFTYPLVEGDTDKALNDPYSILLTKSSAKKYFGNENAFGKTIIMDDSLSLKVTGILDDIPNNSHLKFEFLLPFDLYKIISGRKGNWVTNSYYTYVQLKQNTKKTEVDKKIKDEIKRHNDKYATDIYLQPLLKIHLYSKGKYTADIGMHGNYEYVNIFSLAALIVLFIACINFMNLSTAHYTKRAKEVGLRKVIGANRWQLIKQFYFESFLFAFLALLIAVGISSLLLDIFNNLAGKEISYSSLNNTTIISIIFYTILTGLIAGSYPAIYLSSFLPIKVLKRDLVISDSGTLFRKVLVVVQFTLSLILIIGTIIISSQLSYLKNKDIGYDKENLVKIDMNKTIKTNFSAFKNELKNNPNIVSIGASDKSPENIQSSLSGFSWQGKNKEDKILFHFMYSDVNFINTLKMKITEGRFFEKKFKSDSTSIVINEEAARVIGMKNPVGKILTYGKYKLPIIGIVKDFNFKTLETKIEPIIMLHTDNNFNFMFIRVSPYDTKGTIEYVKSVYKKFSPNTPFNYSFLVDNFDNKYKSETRMQSVFGYFAILAIIISCLGLFGLASFIAERRTKEIGIRKVLGASIFNITYLLSRDFIKWVLISNIIAWPVTYYIMNNWLQSFAYREEISLWMFPLSGIMVLIIAFLTVSYQTIKAARMNPVQSLKYE